jgi:hypothetical protein
VYVGNEVRVGSLYRGVPKELFDVRVRRLFFDLQAKWGGVPFDVVNDGEVTALAGSMALDDSAVLGVAMGSSLAAGFVTPQGNITTWLNELAFVPVDYREDAPADEWSGDPGVGAQYFSQQAVGRLLGPAGIELPDDMPLPVKLEAVQKLMRSARTRAHDLPDHRRLLRVQHRDLCRLLRVPQSPGAGPRDDGRGRRPDPGTAKCVLRRSFPSWPSAFAFTFGRKEKRHGRRCRPQPAAITRQERAKEAHAVPHPNADLSCPTARRPRTRSRAPRTCASRRTRTISRSWRITESRSASGAGPWFSGRSD